MRSDKKHKSSREYSKFSTPLHRIEIDTLDLDLHDDADKLESHFWQEYVLKRKPCLIKNASPISAEDFKLASIGKTLANEDDLLQVEELVSGGFGSGKKRLLMSFDEFLKRINQGECLYMTTQYEKKRLDEEEDDEDEEEEGEGLTFGNAHDMDNANDSDDDEEGEFKVDENGEFIDDFNEEDEDEEEEEDDDEGHGKLLFPQMDASDAESDIDISNLKDDYEEEEDEGYDDESDDLIEIYQPPLHNLLPDTTKIPPIPLPIFEKFSPQQINLWIGNSPNTTLEAKTNSSGNINSINRGIPSKGTSSGLHHDHADNLYTLVEGTKTFSIWSPNHAHNLYTVGDIRQIYDSGIIDYIPNEKAPNWLPLDSKGMQINSSTISSSGSTELDPPSFSKIPPALLHLDEIEDEFLKDQLNSYLEEKFPLAKDLVKAGIRVEMNHGDCLYLPAGWFHEVGSSGKHVAVNHWFYVPEVESNDK